MKKIFVAIAVLTAMTFTSCGNSTNSAEEADTTVVAEETDELAALEEAVASGDENAIKAEFDKLKDIVANLDSAEVKKFAYKLQEFAANHKDELSKFASGELTVEDLVSTATSLKSLGKEAGDAATSDANTVGNQVKAAADAAKEQVKEEAKAKAEEAAEAAKAKASEEANKAINNAADALRNKLSK